MSGLQRIVLLDLDGTLVDKSYRYTVPLSEIRERMHQLQARGVSVGLHSDTPLKPLQRYAAELGLNGPVLAERGQILQLTPASPKTIIGRHAKHFADLRHRFVQQAMLTFENTFLGIGDVTEFVRQKGTVYGQDTMAVLVNRYRECSFSVFAFKRVNEALTRDRALFGELLSLLSRTLDSDVDVEIDDNEDAGIVIVHEPGASKTTGIRRLADACGDVDIIMIGDGESDKVVLPSVRVCAVGNASDGLKECAQSSGGFVATSAYTEGVLELLQRLETEKCSSLS